MAVDQQSQQLHAGKAALSTDLFQPSWLQETGDRRRDVGVAQSEQRACARGFQHHIAAASTHVGEAREHERVVVIEVEHSRRVVAHLRLDDDEILAVAGQPILQQTAMRQAPDESVDFRSLVLDELQPRLEFGGALDGLRAKLAERDRLTVAKRRENAIRLALEGYARAEPGEKHCRRSGLGRVGLVLGQIYVRGSSGLSSASRNGRLRKPSLTGTS